MKTLKLITGFLFALASAVTALTFAVCDPFGEAALSGAQAKQHSAGDAEASWRAVRTAFERCGSLLRAERDRLEADTRKALESALKGLVFAFTGRPDAKGELYSELSRLLRSRKEDLGLDFLAVLTQEGLVPSEDANLGEDRSLDSSRSLSIEVGNEKLEAYLFPARTAEGTDGVGEPLVPGPSELTSRASGAGPSPIPRERASGDSSQEICLLASVPVKDEGDVARALLLGGRSLASIYPRLEESLRALRTQVSWHTFLALDAEGPVEVSGCYSGSPVRRELLEKLAREPQVESSSIVEGEGERLGKFGRIYAPTREVIGGWGVTSRPLARSHVGERANTSPQFTQIHWLVALGSTLLLGLVWLILPSGLATKRGGKPPVRSAEAPASSAERSPTESLLAELQTSWKTFAYYMNQLVSRTLQSPRSEHPEDFGDLRERLANVANDLSRLRADIAVAAERIEAVHGAIGAASTQPAPKGDSQDAPASSEAVLRKLESDVAYLAALFSQMESPEAGALESCESVGAGAVAKAAPVLAESKAVLRALEEGLREARRLNQVLVDELATSRRAEDALRLDLAEAEARKAALVGELETQAAKQREALEEREESARREGEISVSLKAVEKLRAEAQAEAERLRSECEALKAELQRARDQGGADTQELQALRSELEAARSEAARLAEELRQANEQLAVRAEKSSSLSAALETAERRAGEFEVECATLRGERAALSEELRAARSERDALAQRAAELEAKLEELQSELSSSRAALEEWGARARSWEEERRSLEEKARSPERPETSTPSGQDVDSRALEQLRAEKAHAEELLSALRAKSEEDAARLRKLEADAAAERARANRAEQESRSLAARVSALQATCDASRVERERLETERMRLAQELEAAERRRREELSGRESELQVLRARVNVLEERTRNLTKELGAKSEEVSRLRSELEEAEKRRAAPQPAATEVSIEEPSWAEEARCRALFEESLERSFPAVLVVLDQEDRVVTWSSAAARLFDISEEEAIGKQFFELDTPLRKEGFRNRFQENKQDAATHLFRVRIRSGSGAESYFVTQAPLLGADASSRGSILLLQPASFFERGKPAAP